MPPTASPRRPWYGFDIGRGGFYGFSIFLKTSAWPSPHIGRYPRFRPVRRSPEASVRQRAQAISLTIVRNSVRSTMAPEKDAQFGKFVGFAPMMSRIRSIVFIALMAVAEKSVLAVMAGFGSWIARFPLAICPTPL